MPTFPNLSVLIAACRLYFKPTTLTDWKEAANDLTINWYRVYDLAEWHQVRPLLFEALRQHSPSHLPVDYFKKLQIFCRQLAVENLSRVRQTQDLVRKLEAADIKTVLHKGVHYAGFYWSVAHREFGDIDVLIEPQNLKKATGLMQEWGYRSDLDYAEGANVVDLDYHSTFFPAVETGLSPVEIHWKPHIRTHIKANDLVQNRTMTAIYNTHLPVPATSSVFLLMATHHGTKEYWHKLKYLCDLSSLLLHAKQEIDWDAARKINLDQSLKDGIGLIGTVLEIDTTKANEGMTNHAVSNANAWLTQANEISTDDAITQNAKKSNENFVQKTSRLAKKYQVMSLTTQSYLWRAAVAVAVIKMGLKIMPYPVFKQWYDKWSATTSQKTFSNQDLKKAAWAIGVVSARWPWQATCLPQALTFKYLHRHDPRLQLQIGVNKNASGELQAHAWVEKEKQILIGNTPETFQPIWEWEQ